MIERLALQALDRIERLEAQRLAWGLVDGGFSRDELDEIIGSVIESEEEKHGKLWLSVGEVLDVLMERVLLWRTPGSRVRYRSRSAEAVRLFSRLRQMFKAEHWQSGAPLVSDFRYQVNPRRFPRRALPPATVIQRLDNAVGLAPSQLELLKWVLGSESEVPLLLSEFQVQAADSVLSGLTSGRTGATVVAAGTGAGKTLAFLLPTLLHLVANREPTRYAKAIAVYPRNELLKDQLRSVLERVIPLTEGANSARRTLISVGALFGSVPKDLSTVTHRSWGWKATGAGPDVGYVCPFLQCPKCGGDLVWREADIEDRTHALKCSNPRCGARIPDGVLRLTRQALCTDPPDILFTSTEMMNRSMSDPRLRQVIGLGAYGAPRVLLLDEIHTYGGTHGAQVALLLRRWRRLAKAKPHVIGLSATLADASRFMSELTGVFENNIRVVEPSPAEMDVQGAEYTLALRGDPVSEASLLSTTIQAAILMGRILDDSSSPKSGGAFGTKVFAFGDNLDVINRLHDDLADAEGFGRRSRQTGLGSLANLRSPAIQPVLPRWEAGQNWEIAADVGHALRNGAHRRVARVSSQDSGVDKKAPTIVATASLEVGFDDPSVGAVIQHKAPRDPAAYIQRRGRAGRSVVMRPWTVVVLSDYGRDRLAYQRYEDVFSPVVPARFLPIRNPFVLKIQASFALLDWIAKKVPVRGSDSVFKLLAKPVGESQWYADVASLLTQILEDPQPEAELRAYLADVLEIDDREATGALWAAPRSLMLEVIPTILRRIETNWDNEVPVDRSPLPLPEFLPSALFADLNLPELAIILPQDEGEERMPFRQGLSEFAPGRVSRRFGATRQNLAHWVPVPYQEDTDLIELQGILDRRHTWELGEFQDSAEEGTKQIRVVRPTALIVEEAPRTVSSTSNAFLLWRSQFAPSSGGRRLRLPPAAIGRFHLESVEGFLHGRGASVEVRRFAVGVDAETKPERAKTSVPPRRYRFELSGEPVALGYAQPVDALRFRMALPSGLAGIVSKDPLLLRHLRVLRFSSLLRDDERLRGLANKFQIDWVVDAVLATLGMETLRLGRTTREVAEDESVMTSERWITSLRTIFDLNASPAGELDDTSGLDQGEGVGTAQPHPMGGRRFRDLEALLRNPVVLHTVRSALPSLYEAPSAGWEGWLERLMNETMGAAVLAATQTLIHEMSFDDLLVDVVPRSVGSTDAGSDEFDIWVSEDTPGGAGLIERAETSIQEDPQRFLALLEGALEASDPEQARVDLGLVASWLAPSSPDHISEVEAAAKILRAAQSHEDETDGLEELKAALTEAGLFLHPVTLAAVNLRLLRPGSSASTDDLYHTLYSKWSHAEDTLGFEVNPRVLAEMMSHDDTIDDLLSSVTEGRPPEDRAHWRFSALNGLLWPSRGTLRLEGLRYYNPFAEPPTCDRLLITSLIKDDVPVVDVAPETWRDDLATAIRDFGAVDLISSEQQGRTVRSALLDLAVTPLDVGALAVHPRVRGFAPREGSGAVRIEVPELFGVGRDG